MEVADDDDLRLVAHGHVGVALLRALRRTFQDLELEPERRVHPHLPDLFGLALRPGDLGPDLHRLPLLLQDLLAQYPLMLMALRILEILPNLLNRGVEHAVVSHVCHSFLLRDMDDVPGGLYFVYSLKAVGKDSISRACNVGFSPAARAQFGSNQAGIPDFPVVYYTASTAREFDSFPMTPGLTRVTSPCRPALTRAASHSDPNP